jgi:hypothetical protein
MKLLFFTTETQRHGGAKAEQEKRAKVVQMQIPRQGSE